MAQNYTFLEKDITQYLGQITVDSLKIRISFDKCTIVDDKILCDKYIVDAATGGIDKEFKENRYKHYKNGVSTSYGIEDQVTSHQNVERYMVILFNSKLLSSRYFEGITKHNIYLVYLSIISQQKVFFTFDDFIGSSCTDVDFKKDVLTSTLNENIKTMHLFAKESKRANVGCNIFSEYGNKGIEWSSRKRATPANPFLKIYHKGLELVNKSKDFHREYLGGFNIDKLVRVETTIKNRKHFKRYNIYDTTLNGILNLSQDKLQDVLKDILDIHLNKRIVAPKTPTNMKPSHAVHFASITSLMDLGLSYNSIREMLVGAIRDSVGKCRMRKTLDSIYEESIAGSEVDTLSKQQTNFFNSIGWC